MTIKNATKVTLPKDLSAVCVIGDKIVTAAIKEEKASWEIETEIGEDIDGVYTTEIGVTDPASGEYKAITTLETLRYGYFSTAFDGKTVFYRYTPASDYEKFKDKITDGKLNYGQYDSTFRTLKIDVSAGKTKEILSDFALSSSSFFIISDKTLLVAGYEQRKMSKEDYIARYITDEEMMHGEESYLTLYKYDTESGTSEPICSSFTYLIPKQGEVTYSYPDVFEDGVLIEKQTIDENGVFKAGFDFYDSDLNYVFGDWCIEIQTEGRANERYVRADAIMQNDSIYVEGATGMEYTTSYFCYSKTADGFVRNPMEKPEEEYPYFSVSSPRVNTGHPFSCSQITDYVDYSDESTLFSQMSYSNPFVGENYLLGIDLEGFIPPHLMQHGYNVTNDYSDNYLLVGNGSSLSGENSFSYWFVPADEVHRAVFGE